MKNGYYVDSLVNSLWLLISYTNVKEAKLRLNLSFYQSFKKSEKNLDHDNNYHCNSCSATTTPSVVNVLVENVSFVIAPRNSCLKFYYRKYFERGFIHAIGYA